MTVSSERYEELTVPSYSVPEGVRIEGEVFLSAGGHLVVWKTDKLLEDYVTWKEKERDRMWCELTAKAIGES